MYTFNCRKGTSGGNESGATIVEYAIILPLFFILMLSVFDLLRLSFNALSMQYVAARVMRVAALGAPSPLPAPHTSFESYLKDEIITQAKPFGFSLLPENISFCPVGAHPCATDNAGKPRQLITVRLRMPVTGIIIGDALGMLRTNYFLGTTLIAKNEPR